MRHYASPDAKNVNMNCHPANGREAGSRRMRRYSTAKPDKEIPHEVEAPHPGCRRKSVERIVRQSTKRNQLWQGFFT
jgi:hypothetical protein